MRTRWNLTVKKILLATFLFLIPQILHPGFDVLAQVIVVHPATATESSVSAQPVQSPLAEIPLTPRSKLEIIQYVLLSFAIGASIWIILRLEKMEKEGEKENNEKS